MSKLYFRYGAMNCGKSLALLQVAHNYEEKGMKVLVIKSSIDKKADDRVSTRLGIERKVDILINEKESILKHINFEKISCILVDEAQFLTPNQVKELWLITKLKNIPVICYGLKTTFQGTLFTGSKPLLELADIIEELITVCSCGQKAKFNARILKGKYVKEGNEVAIDGIDASYEPLCPNCYIEKVLGINTLDSLNKEEV